MSLYLYLEWLQHTPFSTAIRESAWVFPIIETTHVLGLAVSVGLLTWFDLRLLGLVMRHQPVSVLHKQMMPWSTGGFAIMFASGILLFWSNPLSAYSSIFFRLKFCFLLLAGLNALTFELTTKSNIAEWDKSPVPPARVRLTGALSLVLWMAVITFGRATAYKLL